MTIFTVRTIAPQGNQLSSAQMRSRLAAFLRQPHSLPPDPGAGENRVSFNLPRESVCDLAEFLRCSPSSALRRLALHPMRPSSMVPVVRSAHVASSDSTSGESEYAHQNLMPSAVEGEILATIIAVLFLLSLAVLFFVINRKRKRTKKPTKL
jgi:hypothetical protein